MPGYSDLHRDGPWTEFYDQEDRMSQCSRCAEPTRIRRVYQHGSWFTDVFQCPHNRFAPLQTNNCRAFRQVPGIEELWE